MGYYCSVGHFQGILLISFWKQSRWWLLLKWVRDKLIISNQTSAQVKCEYNGITICARLLFKSSVSVLFLSYRCYIRTESFWTALWCNYLYDIHQILFLIIMIWRCICSKDQLHTTFDFKIIKTRAHVVVLLYFYVVFQYVFIFFFLYHSNLNVSKFWWLRSFY